MNRGTDGGQDDDRQDGGPNNGQRDSRLAHSVPPRRIDMRQISE
jgi:hypothetical protein